MHSVTKPGTHDFRRELTGEDSLKSWLKQSQQALKEIALAGVTEGGTSHQSGNYRLKSLPSGDQGPGMQACPQHLPSSCCWGLLAATALSSEAVDHVLKWKAWPTAFLPLGRLFLEYSYAELVKLAP